MLPTITIREYTEKDRNEILLLMVEFCDYIEALDPLKLVQYKQMSAQFYTDLMLKKNKEKGKIFVAIEGATIIGFIGGHISEQSEDEQMELVKMTPGHITDIFVTKAARGNNVGQMLMEKLESYFKENKATVAQLEVFAPNEIAREFYAKLGFVERIIGVSKILTQ